MAEVSVQVGRTKKSYEVSEILIWSFYSASPLHLITQSAPFLGLIHPSISFSRDKEEETFQLEGK